MSVKNIVEGSWVAYQEGGMRLLGERTRGYIKNNFSIIPGIYNPKIPPVRAEAFEKGIRVGYRDKYIYNGEYQKVMPRSGDIVVEAGVYLGRDTATFSKFAKRVIAFEPSPRNYNVAKKNLRKFENIDIINKGLWNKKDVLEIKYGGGSHDDGFLKPDDDSKKRVKNIPVNTLEGYSKKLEIGHVDFVKIEAEGAEPEVIEGMGELRPRSIVVNADEERDGQATGAKVMELLQQMGYKLVAMKDGHILFFTLDDVSHEAFRDLSPNFRTS